MKDLTQGSITRHLIEMAFVMLIGMIGQTLYYLVDLYFVAQLGSAAVAGVGAAGNDTFIVLGLTQILGVGALALISHAVGRRDQADANLVFNQAIALSALAAICVLVGGYFFADEYMRALGADAPSAIAGTIYLYFFLPGLALQFALVAMGSALRGTGLVKPSTTVQIVTVLINAMLAPVLIAGWGTRHPLGVAGAGLASTIAVACGVLMLCWYFVRLEKYVGFHPAQWRPRWPYWRRILNIGLPAGSDFLLLFLTMTLTYELIRRFGAQAQAGYGIGSRVMQSIFLPAMAVAFSVAPVAGQNFGAGKPERVRETVRIALTIVAVMMGALTLLCQISPASLIRIFTGDAAVVRIGAYYLQVISWIFVGSGIVFTCSGAFQALGNTWPSLMSGVSRLVFYAAVAIWLALQPGFRLEQIWFVWLAAVCIQALISLSLLRREMSKRLGFAGQQLSQHAL
jgi:putative MATE family efflux protein